MGEKGEGKWACDGWSVCTGLAHRMQTCTPVGARQCNRCESLFPNSPCALALFWTPPVGQGTLEWSRAASSNSHLCQPSPPLPVSLPLNISCNTRFMHTSQQEDPSAGQGHGAKRRGRGWQDREGTGTWPHVSWSLLHGRGIWMLSRMLSLHAASSRFRAASMSAPPMIRTSTSYISSAVQLVRDEDEEQREGREGRQRWRLILHSGRAGPGRAYAAACHHTRVCGTAVAAEEDLNSWVCGTAVAAKEDLNSWVCGTAVAAEEDLNSWACGCTTAAEEDLKTWEAARPTTPEASRSFELGSSRLWAPPSRDFSN
eukprot:355986-Chlamydomonas_euryale.AAC.16